MLKLLIFVCFSFSDPVLKADSIGIETINGKMFIIHRVEEKETLYAISRRYGATVDAILQQNPDASSGIEIGQILKVPYSPKQKTEGAIHKVAPKETLFSIARLYGVSMDELKQWNKLTDNTLSAGQELLIRRKGTTIPPSSQPEALNKTDRRTHIVAQKETLFSIARQYGITMDQLKGWNRIEGNELKTGQELIVSPEPALSTTQVAKQAAPKIENNHTSASATIKPSQETVITPSNSGTKNTEAVKTEPKEQTIRISESVRNGDEIIESGVAELIEGTDGNRKYLALHRTAPVGTILKVRNEMNNREVFVRVMGKLPETGVTDKLIIKVSKSAYDRLGAIDQRFRVEVTYYK